MYGSAYIAANYLNQFHPEIKRVRVVGMNSICAELSKLGIESVGGEDEIIKASTFDDLYETEIDKTVGAVVVGLDTKFTYQKLALASK